MKVLIAPDKFKGSLSAQAAAQAMARGWERGWPGCELELAPIADGGEGFASAFQHGQGGDWVSVAAHDALGREIEARYLWIAEKQIAAIEMSECSGMWRLTREERDPMCANTFGTGELMRDAVKRGAREIYVGLGGSATTDAGTGMALALGYRFLDRAGNELTHFPAELPKLARISREDALPLPRVISACDVSNPLLGPRGTAHIFAPQKGADAVQVGFLENALAHLAEIVARDLGCDHRETPGAGAAGGLGYGLLSFANACVCSGFDIVSEMLELPRLIRECDIVLTGEGSLDRQTLEGKGPAGIAALAREAGKPVIGFGGAIDECAEVAAVFDALCPIVSQPVPLAEAMARGAEFLERAAARASGLARLGALRLATRATRADS